MVVSLALAACGKPCALICQDNLDCAVGFACINHQQCLPTCLMRTQTCGNQCIKDTFHNCETCGVPCAAGQVCTGAALKCGTACDSGYSECSGSCYSLGTDPFNCGACGHACQQDEVCASGTCQKVISC